MMRLRNLPIAGKTRAAQVGDEARHSQVKQTGLIVD
jgi:hypothetical protein